MHETRQGCPADLVFNLDEVEISDLEDRKPKNVVVPITVAAHNIHHRISRNMKHISVVACISSGCRRSSPGSRGNQDADWEAFDLETTRQTLRQR
jgi:hypothetical protein